MLCNILLLTIFFFLASTTCSAGKKDLSRDKLVTVYIFRLAEHIQWANESEISEYHIHLIGASRNIYKQLKSIGKLKKLHGKPIKVTRSSDIDLPEKVHLVYLSHKKSKNYKALFKKIEGKNVLLISDKNEDQRRVMINLKGSKNKKINFEINKANIINQNLGISPDIILLGGTEIDVARLYKKGQASLKIQEERISRLEKRRKNVESTLQRVQTKSNELERELIDQKERLSNQSKILKQQQKQISKQEKAVTQEKERLKKAIDKSKKQEKIINKQKQKVSQEQTKYKKLLLENTEQQDVIASQRKAVAEEQQHLHRAIIQVSEQKLLIDQQQQRIKREEQRYQELAKQSSQQQSLIKQQHDIVEQEQNKYKKLTAKVRQREIDLEIQAKKIESRTAILSEQDEKIERQQRILDQQAQIIATQLNFLYVLGITVILIIILALVLLRGYHLKKNINAKLLKQQNMLEQTASQLAEAKAAADKANQSKSIFLANMSHELRTPLNAILGFSQLLQQNSNIPESELNNLSIINRSGEHLLNLINDVLDMSKIEAGSITLEPENFDLGSMLRDIVDMMDIRAKEKGLELIFDQSSIFPRFILGDQAKFRQILINLLSNSIKFTNVGRICLKLDAESPEDETMIKLICSVEDTGIGIPAEQINDIFDPFKQIESNKIKNTGQKGTGLGMSISKQFVEMMGGHISVKSEVNKGSIFLFTLQVKKATEQIMAKEHQKGKIIGIDQEQGKQSYRVLIVEDHNDSAALLQKLLSNAGFDVQIAENGAIAVDKFKQWYPHFIWMDRRMPVMDGIESTIQIRRLKGGDIVKIVALTASALKEDQEEIMKHGFDDFVRKPYIINEIFDCMAGLLNLTYLYEQTEIQNNSAVQSQVTATSFHKIPAELKAALKDASIELDIEKLQELAEQVAELDEELAIQIRQIINSFNFDNLINVLDN